MISSMSVPICKRIHAGRANRNLKKNFLGRYPSFTLSFKKNPLTQRHEISSQKTRVLVAAYSEDFVILACIVLIQSQSVTDRQTDASTIAKTRYRPSTIRAVARQNGLQRNCRRYIGAAQVLPAAVDTQSTK